MTPAPDDDLPDALSQSAAPLTVDPWQDWRAATPARLALGRAGAGLPTAETLRFGWAHAAARDAIHAPLDADALEAVLRADDWPRVERVASRANDRTTYLRRPDLGRRLEPSDAARLSGGGALSAATGTPDTAPHRPVCDVSLTIADGLSSLAATRHAVPLLAALRRRLPATTRFAPITIAVQARVAIADEIGEALGARIALILIGERPGLSSPDSLGAYLTFDPRRGRHDAERNCVSNIRPEGLPYEAAAFKLAWLIREATRRGATGVGLKDESDLATLEADGPADGAAAISSVATMEGGPRPS